MLVQQIQTKKPYSVCIGSEFLSRAGAVAANELPGLTRTSIVIISDSNVMPLYGQTVAESFREAGCQVSLYEIPAGESSKNWSLLGDLVEHFAKLQLTRSDYLVALGGGVTGDLTGFAASIYLRGISFLQIPTTLLAAVDSSVGGKTAVNLSAGKNLAGTFWQPRLVLCDTAAFDSLPKEAFLDGVSESIKYGIIRDQQLFQDILQDGLARNPSDIVARCIAIKGGIVAEDEFDLGTRELLNLGHTFGHAIEHLSHFKISHGHAVAIGMNLAGETAERLKLCSRDCSQRITSALTQLGLPVLCPFPMEELFQVMLQDKKRKDTVIDLILPHDIGDCRIHTMTLDQLKEALSI